MNKEILHRPGYFGSRRLWFKEHYDELYGEGGWMECWEYSGDILPFEDAVYLYDLSYMLFLREHRWIAELIAAEYWECYDNSPDNIRAGCNHDPLAVPRHLQDVSVRKALRAMGLSFNQDKSNLLEIRGPKSNGYLLSPMIVTFVEPGRISPFGPAEDWVKKGSVEEFWQRNKVIIKV